MPNKLIIWDFDGTIADTLPVTFDAINDVIEPFVGARWTPLQIMTHFGVPEDQILAKIVGQKHAAQCFQDYLFAAERRLAQVQAFPGIVDALRELSARGLSLAIYTGRSRRATDLLLKHLELDRHFAKVVTATEVKHHKPHPEGIHQVCQLLGIAEKNAVMIGDSPMDIHAGVAAGTALSIGCTWDSRAEADVLTQAGAHHVVAHPLEILKLVIG